ncbi:hypothetical protein KZZ52_55670 [Dactylosporangium sp. AC04546]|uniref:hypothetical protein n=1 Tax=Dactylosporangium sp. AC04546 TaxID=2862460 RepID=UPI001EDCF615|nr:hypothetical protein [Dactylosporangium sp. AC04546]WVK83065.1 hypothetical protein KZZ52_55670 [Dactylosporangium sp. AC04546]
MDAGVALLFAAAAALLTSGLWADPARRALALNPNDQALDEWFLAYATRAYRGDFSLVTGALNAPDGVNLLCNASLVGLGLLFAPVTLAFGPHYTFLVVTAVNLAATGTGWYLLLARTAGLHRLAALVGGAFAGFAPGMVSQSNGHLHMTAAWLVPPIVWCVLRLATDPLAGAGRTIRRGLLLGALVTAQFFVGEEVLFLTATGLALFCGTYWLLRRPSVARLAAGLAIGGALATLLLAYPLWLQFHGPQSVDGGVFLSRYYSADLHAFTAISPLSLAGDDGAARLASGPAEYTTFFGWPVLLVVAGGAVWLWRRPAVTASAVAALVLCLLALGPRVVAGREQTDHWGPFALLDGLPVVESALPTRFALAAIPLLAYVLARVVDAAVTQTETLRLLVPVAVVAALAPLAPVPLPTQERPAAPRFFTEGYWRTFAPADGTIVPVPLPDSRDPQAMRWAAAAGVGFATPQGWFIGPYGRDGRAAVGIYPRPTAQLLQRAAQGGTAPELTDKDRVALRRDIAYWRASSFVLADWQPGHAALKATLDGLLGPGERVADVWVWRARSA